MSRFSRSRSSYCLDQQPLPIVAYIKGVEGSSGAPEAEGAAYWFVLRRWESIIKDEQPHVWVSVTWKFPEVYVLKSTSRISDLKYKLMTIELLNLAKNYYTYRELAQIINLPETVLSRYVKGHVLPTIDRSQSINKTLQKIMRLEAEIQQRIRFDELGYFDNTRLISDTLLMERAVQQAINSFAGTRITKVLAAAVDGIPLATLIAHRLGVGLVVAKKTREVGVREFIEEIYIPSKTALVMNLYVPRDAMKRGDCVLIVDDVIDSGETQVALAKIVHKAKAEVTGVYALISIGSDWQSRLEQIVKCPVEVVLQVAKKPMQEAT